MSYGELARRAARLAETLTAQGVEPNTLVGISIAKGWQQIVAVLGTLIAGAAYLPIDPALPEARRHFLIDHGQVRVLVTAQEDAARWPDGLQHVVVEADDSSAAHRIPDTPLQTPADLAYLLYTSGSTGTPKGVAITHRAAWNTVLALNDRFGVGPADRVLSLSSLSFDLSVYDMFGLLAAGGAVVLPDPGTSREPRRWLELCKAHGVTIWHSVPALMEMAVEQASAGPPLPASLRLVFMGGDWISTTLPERIRAFSPTVQVVAFGGTTEASIHSTVFPADRVDPTWESIPYGKPLPNQRMAVLNERLEPRPIHVPGDLYFGGMGLAQGYWRDPVRTAASFVRDPRTGERLYRTGDLARYLPNGDVEFLGREDSQVKVGGYRIELGEIETHLTAHPQVRAAAVTAIGDPRRHTRLVAFVVPDRPAPTGALAPANDGDSVSELNAAMDGATAGVITDPMERFEFKMRRHGLRRLEAEMSVDIPSGRAERVRRTLATARRSQRQFGGTPVSLDSLGRLLEALRASDVDGLTKHRYGSAGGLYPVQTYLWTGEDQVAGAPIGTYYYDPESHVLRAIKLGVSLPGEVHASTNRELAAGAAFTIALVADLSAVEPMYGDKAERFSYIEAGLIAQLLEMEAPECEIGLCQVALGDTPALRDALRLTEHHLVLHGLVGGQRALDPDSDGRASPASDTSLWTELREHLARSVPDYMVPGQFVAIEQVPLSANGKVDRAALSALAPTDGDWGEENTSQGRTIGDADTAERFSRRLAEAPGGDRSAIALEVVRTEVAAILGCSPRSVSAARAFSELGFESLQAVKLRNRLEAVTGLRLPATMVFDHPTPRSVAERVLRDSLSDELEDDSSAEDELTQIEQRLRSLASNKEIPASVATRLHSLVSSVGVSDHDTLDSDLAEATPENILELVDRELGES